MFMDQLILASIAVLDRGIQGYYGDTGILGDLEEIKGNGTLDIFY